MHARARRILIFAALCAPSILVAQRPAPGDRAEILRLENGWANALVKRDKPYFAKTLAAGFIYTEDNRLMTREEVLRDIVTPADTVISATNENMTVHLFGTTAVVTGRLVIDGRTKGSHYHHPYQFTDTWVKQRDGHWKIVAAQDYLIPAGR